MFLAKLHGGDGQAGDKTQGRRCIHQSQGLVEHGIKSKKHQLYHKLDPSIRSPVKLQYTIISLNNMVRRDGSSSATQMFFSHTLRSDKFGLVTPAKVDKEKLAEARSKSHRTMRERTKGNRKLEQFMKNDRILLQDDKTGCFDQRATVIGPRDRRSEDLRTFHIRKDQYG